MIRVFSLFLCLFLTATTVFSISFKDMRESHWAADDVQKVVDMGITTGFPDGTFRGTKTMNRYEISIFLAKMAAYFEGKLDVLSTKIDARTLGGRDSKKAEKILTEIRSDVRNLKADVEWLKKKFKTLNKPHIQRKLTPVYHRSGSQIGRNGQVWIDFSSNDYLGRAQDPDLVGQAIETIQDWGVGSTGSRLLSGDTSLAHEAEQKLAKLKQKPAALIYNTGFQLNSTVIPQLVGPGDGIFLDRLCHASLVDGCFNSGATPHRYAHQDMGHLDRLLSRFRNQYNQILLVAESVFSMDGDRADISALVDLKNKYNGQLWMDEAHATGVFGPGGAGCVADARLSDQVDYVMGTCGKALGSFGAFLATDEPTKNRLVNRSRGFIYSTALPPSSYAVISKVVDQLPSLDHARRQVLALAERLRSGFQARGFVVLGDTPIVPVLVGSDEKAVNLANRFKEAGIWVDPIRPPTVPPGQSRLRFTVTAMHTESDIEAVLAAVDQ